MFNEEKVKKDLEKMRAAYDKALKSLDEIQARQAKIAEKIYTARKSGANENK
jgi:flagellar biosynthesis chaperone FliJ